MDAIDNAIVARTVSNRPHLCRCAVCGIIAAIHLENYMVRNLVAVSAMVLGLAGCSLGISSDSASPHSEFKAPVAFKDAYASVIRQSMLHGFSTGNSGRT